MGEEEENKTQLKEALAERGPFAGDSGEGRGGQGDLTRRPGVKGNMRTDESTCSFLCPQRYQH